MDLRSTLVEERIAAVLVIDRPDDAVPVARALVEGGVRVMELTLRTDTALESLRRIRREVGEMIVGAGTVLSAGQLREAHDAGAQFAVSPGVNVDVVCEARAIGLPFAPGVMTPTDVDLALREGCQLLKFFPAESSGGLPHLNNIAAPFAHLKPLFMPLGGIHAKNLPTYLASPLVAAVGGSWLAPRDVILSGDFDRIRQNAAEAKALIQSL